MILKKVRLLKKEHGMLFSKIIVNVTLPALIISSLIGQAFSGDPQAMQEAVVTSKFGVGFLLFIFGPLIAMYFGGSGVDNKVLLRSAGRFFISPVFVSLVAGIGLSYFSFEPDNEVFRIGNKTLHVIADANTFLVALAVGLMIEVKVSARYILFLSLAVILKLLVKPLLTYLAVDNPNFTDMMQEILVIETAMPSAILGAVFAKQYNCNPELVSSAVVVTLIVCLFTVPMIFLVLF
ncbi:MAG: AEC family transporter [Bacteroidales bacterium]